MEALIAAPLVDRFLEENVSDDDSRAWLDRTLPGIDAAGEATAALALDAARRSTPKERQQLLATMVLMGVNPTPRLRVNRPCGPWEGTRGPHHCPH